MITFETDKQTGERTVTEFEIRQLTPCRGVIGIWKVESEDGGHELVSRPLDAIGTAMVTCSIFDANHRRGQAPKLEGAAMEIVGLELAVGDWHIVDADDNFVCMAKEGDDIDEIAGFRSGGVGCGEVPGS